MQTPLQITFRHMTSSPAVEARVSEEVAALEHHFDRITSCHVTIEAPHHHHEPQGRTFHVSIEMAVPRSRIVVSHEPARHDQTGKQHERQPDHKDVYVCIRDAFAKAKRQLDDYANQLRGDSSHAR